MRERPCRARAHRFAPPVGNLYHQACLHSRLPCASGLRPGSSVRSQNFLDQHVACALCPQPMHSYLPLVTYAPPPCLNSDAGAICASPLRGWRRWSERRRAICALICVSLAFLVEPAVASEQTQREDEVRSRIESATRERRADMKLDLERRHEQRGQRRAVRRDTVPTRRTLPRASEIELPGTEEEVAP